MTSPSQPNQPVPQRSLLPTLVLVAVVCLGLSIASDLTGTSFLDQQVMRLGSFPALRVYLWIEGGLFAAAVTYVGLHVARAGFSITRNGPVNMFGMPMRVRAGAFPSAGYIFVVLGAALVALAITSLAVLNTCRYMRIV